jgi:hypothetical protein
MHTYITNKNVTRLIITTTSTRQAIANKDMALI